MKGIMLCIGITLFFGWPLIAQVEEIPALESKEVRQVEKETNKESEPRVVPDTISTGRDDRPVEHTEQLRSFLTFNFMVVVIVILIVALTLFLIINRVRQSKKT